MEWRRKASIKRIEKREDVILRDCSRVYQDFKWIETKTEDGSIFTQTDELKWFTWLEIYTKQQLEDLGKMTSSLDIQQFETELVNKIMKSSLDIQELETELIDKLVKDRKKHKELSEQINNNINQKCVTYTPYPQETFPEHILFMKDTNENRGILTLQLSDQKIEPLMSKDFTYIEINLVEKSWRVCNAFEWLYRNSPPLIDIEDLLSLIK